MKDEQVWKTWLANGAKEATRPVIALAPPKSGQKTFLSLIDAKGHESRMLEIKCWTSSVDGDDD